jgi:hypothetical protein
MMFSFSDNIFLLYNSSCIWIVMVSFFGCKPLVTWKTLNNLIRHENIMLVEALVSS